MTARPDLLAALVAAVMIVGALAWLTALGERRRGQSWPVAVVAGVFFPVTWVAWYLRDDLPGRHMRD
jgi:hypothetical protein